MSESHSVAAMREMRARGMTEMAIARKLGVSRGMVRRRLAGALPKAESAAKARALFVAAAHAACERDAALLRPHLANGMTLRATAAHIGMNYNRAQRVSATLGLTRGSTASRGIMPREPRKTQAQRTAERDAEILAGLKRLKRSNVTVNEAASRLKASHKRIRRVWAAYSTEPFYVQPVATKKEARIEPVIGHIFSVNYTANAGQSAEWQEMVAKVRSRHERARAHAHRTRALPPVTDEEAARLVAEALARGKTVTVCPPAYVLPVVGAGERA